MEAFILSLLPDFHLAADILQNVAVVVVRKREEFDAQRPFLPWALQIAKLEVLKHRRTLARDRHLFSDELVEQVAQAAVEVGGDLIARRRALADCIQRVNGRSRRALLLRYVEGLKSSEVARRMSLAGGATRTLLMRVRQTLRKCIENNLAWPDGNA